MKHNLLKSVILSIILLMGVSNAWALDFTSGTVVYFDNTETQWSKIYLRVGKINYNSAYLVSTKVSGTQNLYKYTIPSWNGYEAFSFANSQGWTDNNSIYQPWNDNGTVKPNGSYTITGQTEYFKWNLDKMRLFIPASKSNKEHNCQYYTTNVEYNNYQRTVTITSPTNGSITVTYKDESDASQSKNSGNFKVAQTCIITVSATPSAGYELKSLKIGGSSHTSGNTYIVRGDVTIEATFSAKTYTVTLNNQGATTAGATSVTATYGSAMPSIASNLPKKTGYTFKGYYDATSGGTQYYKADGTSNKNWDKTAATTLHAQWELATYTITYDNLKGATHTNPATYTINSATITFTAPTSKPAGYTFANWSPASIATGSTGNKTVTANWTAATSTVELNQEEATEKGTASVTATYGSAMPTITKLPIRTGYTFGGYYTGKNGAGTQYYKADGTSATTWNLEGAQTLYAKWTPITYSVKFNGNGSTSGSMSNQSFTYDEAAKALTTNAFKKTGYTFAGWNTAANGSGTSYADKATVRNLTTTNNATINLYAQWTIDKYTLTFLAGEGGEVTATVGGNPISSPAALDYNTQVVLTATPTGENAFTRWVDGNGNQLSIANPYTHTFKATTTIKAEFSVPTTVYLKPEDYWKSDNACFAIVASATGKSDKKIDMESADCENIYYKVDIPAGYTEFKYVRLDPNNKNTVWNETGKLYAENAKGKMYVTPRIYFKPNIHWKSDNARFAVYFWKSSNNSENTWRDLTSIGDDIYTCITPGESYDRAIFCRMDPAKSDNIWDNKWNQTNDLYIDHNSIEGKNLYTVTKADGNNMEGDIGEWHTHWETFAPTFPVILDPFQYGKYGIVYNGTTYMSHPTEEVIVNVALGAQVTVVDAVATSPQYTNNTRYETSVITQPVYSGEITETKNGQPIEICGTTYFASNMVTTQPHRVYLHIPNGELNTAWKNGTTDGDGDDNYSNCVWVSDYLSHGSMEEGKDGTPKGQLVKLTKDTYLSGLGNGEYWYCDIPAGYNQFQFERKKNTDFRQGTGYTSRVQGTFCNIPLTNLNCFTITSRNGQTFDGYWNVTPATTGDYRLIYVEQVVQKSENSGEEWKTIVKRTKCHPSDIIKKRTSAGVDTVSLHIYTRGQNPEVILQQFNTETGEWEDIEAHMVNGPLETTPNMGMLPGRKNAGSNSDVDDFVYDNGIEVIKNDSHDDGCGVWNFPVVQDGNGNITLDLTSGNLKRYSGEYYIRTDNAEGGWNKYTLPGNYMTYSQYAKDHSGFSHYFCKWVEVSNDDNTKFVIANDYGVAISDTLAQDAYTNEHGDIAHDANIRWSWNIVDNKVARAYIQGTWDVSTSTRNRNLVVNYKSSSTAADQEDLLDDSGDWIYQKDFTVKVGSHLNSLTATYPVTSNKTQTFASNLDMLTGSSGNDNDYTVRVLYDFKINKTLVALVPNANQADIAIDVIIERVDQGEATQVQAAIKAARTTEGSTVYAVMSFTKDHIENTTTKTEWERLYYWVSFPFDVRISEVFGFGEYGEHWIMEYYDGEERAKNGCWIDSPTYWRYITDTTGTEWTNGVLKANKGYVLALTRDIADLNIFQHTEQVSLYFPSTELITDIDDEVINTTVELKPYTCTIERNNRYLYDSNWHIIGIPSYANKDQTLKQNDLFYFYTYETSNNTYSVTTADPRDNEETEGDNVTFKSMHSYMVQFAGTINWKAEWQLNAQQLAARKTESAYNTHSLRLELQQNGTLADKTFIKLQDTDGITNEFDLNIDLTKIINSGANIYTLAGKELIQLAGNVLPVGEAIIPLGIQLDAAGEYTFAMPDGTDGITVELIDYETNTRTNMLLDDYTVNLTAGTNEARFALHVKPDKTATNVEHITTPSCSDIRKFIIDGVLYMQKDGILYDAQGHIVR